jgi:hypothetical protein
MSGAHPGPALVDLPPRIQLTCTGAALTIEYRWGGPLALGYFIAAVALVAVLAGLVYVSESTSQQVQFTFGLSLMVLGAYASLGKAINRTTLTVTRGTLRYRHGPLPWSGNRTLPVAAIEQLYCWAKERRARGGGEREVRHYQVHALLRDGTRFRLLRLLDQLEQAQYVEQQIERYLGISDAPVDGEVVR